MKKVIFLVDMNAFYISCEMTRNQKLIGRPSAVAGDPVKRAGIILAANYEARKFGVKTAMTLQEALKCCPSMLTVPPDHSFYEQKSNEVMHLLSSYTPVLEQNSIDEAWLDMTGCEGLFGEPVESAKRIMKDIESELGLWCSIGISENKFLSKMASELKKPMGITELWESDIQEKLWPLPIRSMHGVGKQTAKRLQYLGINTIGELAAFDRGFLIKMFGKYGVDMYEHANGIGDPFVKMRSDDDIKSISRSVTLPEDVSDIQKAKLILMQLADEVGMVARKQEKKGRTVQITLKDTNFKVITRQKSIKPTNITKDIYSVGIELLEANWNIQKAVRLVGIGLSGFEENIVLDQISMMDLMESNSSYDSGKSKNDNCNANAKEEILEKVIDSLKEKHGSSTITRAIFIKPS